MDALQHQHRFMRPSMADPQQQQQQLPPQGPPPPWYTSSPQFQYQPSPQWAPPSSSDHHHHLHPPLPPPHHHHHHPQQSMSSAYPAPPSLPSPYPAPHPNHYHPSHLPPPPPHMPPPIPSYPQPNQTWGNPNWPRQQGWEYPERNIPNSNEEDWAARARAWAAAKASMENQQSQSQFTTVGRVEEHSHVYHDQYQQAADPHFTDIQKSSLLQSGHQQFPVSVTSHRPPVDHLQEPMSFSSGPSSFYASDGSISYDARDGALSADSNPIAPPQGNVLTSSSLYQQEVPSSYSSIPGNGEAGNQNEQFHKPLTSTISSHQEQLNPQPTLPAVGRSLSAEHPHFMRGDHSVEAITDAKDWSSNFDHISTRNDDSHQQTSYMHPNQAGPPGGMDHIAAVSSVHAWTPAVAPGMVFPPIPSGPQFDPPFRSPSSVPGHPAPVFGSIPGPSFRPTIPSIGASFGLGAGTALHPTTAFPGDANGVFNVSERPKKASVPNWLREEIIKKKTVIASSSVQNHTAEDSFQSFGTEGDDRSFRKGDQADSKSIDSTKSTEDEEDDEDDVEAARLAAINQEIKRVLTEVLLKVTDELFDEIATKVLNEDDMMVEVDNSNDSVRHKISPSPPAVQTPKASAKVLIPIKVKTAKVDDATEKSNSTSPGDVLGLADYASEEDEEEEVLSSSVHSTRQINGDGHQQSSDDRKLEDALKREKGKKQAEVEEPKEALQSSRSVCNGEGDMRRKGQHVENELVCDDVGAAAATRGVTGVHDEQVIVECEKMMEFPQKQANDFESKDTADGKACMKLESECGDVITLKSTKDESQIREARSKSEKNGHEGKRSSVNKVLVEEADDAVKVKANLKRSDSGEHRRGENRNIGKEQTDERNKSLKERIKDRGVKPGENVKESDPRKTSNHATTKEDRKDTDKVKRVSAKEEGNRSRERTRDEKADRSRQSDPKDSRRNKRQRSSPGSRGKNSRDNSLVDNISGSSDDTSDNSKQRRLRSKKRSLSPSPVKSRRRQVSRSPHSKHSQRRHSPYSSLETRGRRSRSGTPTRRRR